MRTPSFSSATRGAVFVEHIIAFIPVLYFGLLVWQLIELCVGDLVVRRAASAAARAAVVVLPDDPAYYGGVDAHRFEGARKDDIELAAALVLATNPHFRSEPKVTINDIPEDIDVSRNASTADKLRVVGGTVGLMPWLTAEGLVGVMAAGQPGASPHAPLTVTVQAPFECFAAWVNLVCGGARRTLTASVTYPYQGAGYKYEGD